jgi:hypothetical protein
MNHKTSLIISFLSISFYCFGSTVQAKVISSNENDVNGLVLLISGYGLHGDFSTRSTVKNGKVIFQINNNETKTGYISIENPRYGKWKNAIVLSKKIIIEKDSTSESRSIYISEQMILEMKESNIFWNDPNNIDVNYIVDISSIDRVEADRFIPSETLRLINLCNKHELDINKLDDITTIDSSEAIIKRNSYFQIVRSKNMKGIRITVRSYIFDNERNEIVYISESNPVDVL